MEAERPAEVADGLLSDVDELADSDGLLTDPDVVNNLAGASAALAASSCCLSSSGTSLFFSGPYISS